MQERQLISLRMLLDAPEPRNDVFENLQRFKQQVSEVAADSFYLARIAVRESSRGLGYGRNLLHDFEAQSLAHGRAKVSLHVRSNNDGAIRFYRSAAYEIISSTGLGYYTMQKLL